jgi:catechol 2,3-dioxygenase
VRLQIADLNRSMAFYEDILGLRVLQRADGAATLGPEGSETAIVELREQRGARAVPKRGRLGLFHFAILLPDRSSLGRLYQHLRSLGIPLGQADHLVSEALYLSDRDGLGIEVYADRPRAAWRSEGGQLAMSTDPLDVESLVQAAGDEPWGGMPAGTILGHVHLHVGDLKRAADFYHHTLGLDLTVWGYPGALFFSAGGYHHHLGTNTWATGATAPAADEAQLLDWEMILPSTADVAAASESLTKAGHQVAVDGDARVAADAWGTRVRLVAASR